MAANDDVLDVKGLHRKLQHRMNIGVERRREISDVTVHEELARREADDLVGRYAAIGATDLEIFWPLYLAQTFEIFRILALDFGGPLAIVVKQIDRNFIRSPVRNSPRRPTNRRSTSKTSGEVRIIRDRVKVSGALPNPRAGLGEPRTDNDFDAKLTHLHMCAHDSVDAIPIRQRERRHTQPIRFINQLIRMARVFEKRKITLAPKGDVGGHGR